MIRREATLCVRACRGGEHIAGAPGLKATPEAEAGGSADARSRAGPGTCPGAGSAPPGRTSAGRALNPSGRHEGCSLKQLGQMKGCRGGALTEQVERGAASLPSPPRSASCRAQPRSHITHRKALRKSSQLVNALPHATRDPRYKGFAFLAVERLTCCTRSGLSYQLLCHVWSLGLPPRPAAIQVWHV